MINRIFFILTGVIFITFVYNKVRKNMLSEKESIFWMIGASGILVLGIQPKIINILANYLHIEYAPSLLFMVGIIFCIALIFRLTISTSILNQQTKELAQLIAILEKRVSELEKVGKVYEQGVTNEN